MRLHVKPEHPSRRQTLLTVGAALVFSFLLEFGTRHALEPTFMAVNYSWRSVAASCGLVVAAIAFVWFLTNRLVVALSMTLAFLTLLGFAHVRKMQILDRALVPWDLAQWRQIVAIFPTVLTDAASILLLLLTALLLVGAGVLALSTPAGALGWRWRVGGVGVSALYVWFIAYGIGIPEVRNALGERGIQPNLVWRQSENLARNGFLLATTMNIRSLFVSLPGYSEASVRALMSDFSSQQTPVLTAPAAPAAAQMDVVVYMVESMFDPLLLKVPLSADPMPTMRRLMATFTSGDLLSPVYGGATANAEFEVLTGLSSGHFPEGTYPYQHYLTEPVEALPSIFRSHGYRTLAVHNFHRFYWERGHVYPLLGFDRFIALDELGQALDGPYPSDEVLVDRLLLELADESKPTFCFGVSIVTHGPYEYDRQTQEVRVLSGLDPHASKLLGNYSTALLHADRALARLVEGLKKRKRPTLLVVFGDHLPALGASYSVYRKAKFVGTPMPLTDIERITTVPLLFWSNVPRPREELRLGMSLLGPRVLLAAGIPPQGWFSFVRDAAKHVNSISRDLIRLPDGTLLRPAELATAPESAQAAVNAFKLIGYDRLIGQRYSVNPQEITATALP